MHRKMLPVLHLLSPLDLLILSIYISDMDVFNDLLSFKSNCHSGSLETP